jgi:hypothetical protein
VPSSLVSWGLVAVAATSIAGVGVAVVATTDVENESPAQQVATPASATQTADFEGPGPYPTLEPRPEIRPDASRPIVPLDDAVLARPIVDEFGTKGIEIFDTVTEASYGWIPGRSPAVFQGNAERDPGCDCDVYGRGWARVMAYAQNVEALQRLNAGQPYEDPSRPTSPPSSIPDDRCSGADPDCPTPSPPRTSTP